MLYTVAMGAIFGAFLAYLSASQTLFEEFYKVGDLFPMYFAILAFSIGFASFVNGSLVMRMGMRRLSALALTGNVCCSLLLVLLALKFDGLPPLWLMVSLFFINFFFVGILFGNLNSMAMVPLGEMAGLGAAIIGSLSSAFSVPIAIFIGSFIHTTITPVVIGFTCFGVIASVCVFFAGDRKEHRLFRRRKIR